MVARFGGGGEQGGDKPKETLKNAGDRWSPLRGEGDLQIIFSGAGAWRLGFMCAVCEKGQFSGWRGL